MSFRATVRLAAALATGSALGYLLSRFGVPLAWMLGALVVAALFSIRSGRLQMPVWLRWAGQLTISSAVALNLSAQTLGVIAANLVWMVAAGLILIAAMVIAARTIGPLLGFDRATALFGLLPGGTVEMALLAEQFGGQPVLVAFVQTLRLALIVAFVPIYLLALGYVGHVDPLVAEAVSASGLVFVVASGVAVSLLLFRIGATNPFFVGPLIGVGLWSMFDLPRSTLPPGALIAAQVLLGSFLGAMFNRVTLNALGERLIVACAVSVALVATGLLIGAGFWLAGIGEFGVMSLANTPGGVAEMAIVAKSMAFDPALIVAFHLVRILMIVPFAATIYRVFG